MNPIEKAVLPLRQEAIKRTEQYAINIAKNVEKELSYSNFDMKKSAPYPQSYGMNRIEYMSALRKYKLFSSLVRSVKPVYRMNEPHYVEMDSVRVKRFIEQAKSDASRQYDSFVRKLVSKIGETIDARLEGNHVWSYSLLTVVKPNGSMEVWKTQMIVNISKLGLVFNQWPTRKLKKTK